MSDCEIGAQCISKKIGSGYKIQDSKLNLQPSITYASTFISLYVIHMPRSDKRVVKINVVHRKINLITTQHWELPTK